MILISYNDKKIAIINDEEKCESLSDFSPSSAVTFGLSGKSTITVSSFSDNKPVISVQREIVTLFDERVCQQEFTVENSQGADILKLLERICLMLVCGVSIEVILSCL